jgi:hypothetical protein
MTLSPKSVLSWLFAVTVCVLSALAGCFVGRQHQTEHWTAADTALGEEHEVPYAQSAALQLTEDALRGDGIQAVPEGSRKSRIIVNVRTESIPDDLLSGYKASNRFALFKEIDELASKSPPGSGAPTSGGVNFTLLPNEDLRALARRATGNVNNWQEIAKDNGFSSASDVTPFQNVWVRSSLLKQGTP